MTEAQRWISNRTGRELSDLGLRVADILGYVYKGAHHLPNSAFKEKVNWDGKTDYAGSLVLCVSGSLDTYDFDQLTRLTFACHAACVRCEISGAAPGYLRLMFHLRKNRTGTYFERHPSPEEALATFRKAWPISDDFTEGN